MIPEIKSEKRASVVENELDIRGLCCALWHGKRVIIGFAALFAVIALMISYLVKQEWSAIAITDKPAVNALGNYHASQQIIRNMDVLTPTAVDNQLAITDTDEAYNEFIIQLAPDPSSLLRQYIAFTNQRAAHNLTEELQNVWRSRIAATTAQVERQKQVAEASFQRELHTIEQGLEITKQHKINNIDKEVKMEKLSDANLFMLGKPVLEARLDALRFAGPSYEPGYTQNRAILAALNSGPSLDTQFQTYRYLRTPEEPIYRDSPRRAFWLIMSGMIGGLIGEGVALVRQPT